MSPAAPKSSAKAVGDAAEERALHHLQAQGLKLVARNWRLARGPNARGGEIDLILRDRDGTLVFVEVRARADVRHGGAGATVNPAKQRRLIFAAQSYLMRLPVLPPCRFDVVVLEGETLHWWPGAFDAGG